MEKHIDSYFINDEIALAGSAVNVVKGLTKLGNKCIVTGTIGNDKERTMQTFIGASNYMKKEFSNPKDFKGLKFFHLEGYQIFNSDLSEESLRLAQKNIATISINLTTPHLAKAKKTVPPPNQKL